MRARVGLATVSSSGGRESGEVALHLAGCAACRAEREDIVRVVAVLGLLDRGEAGDPSGHLFGAPGQNGRVDAVAIPAELIPAGPQVFARISSPAVTLPGPPAVALHGPRMVTASGAPVVVVPGKPGQLAPATPFRAEGFLPPRPTTGPLARGPHSHRRPRRRPPTVLISGVILMAALGAGAASYPWSTAGGPGPVVAVAETSASAGLSINAVLRTEKTGRLVLHMTMDGADTGTSYEVCVVTADDDLRLLGEFSGSSAQWTGDVGIPVGELSSVSVREAGGPIVAAAMVVQGTAPPTV